MDENNKRETPKALEVLAVVICYILIILLAAVIVFFAWNAVMPYIFALPSIGYGHAIALCMLVDGLTRVARFDFGG